MDTEIALIWYFLRFLGAGATAFCLGVAGTWLHLKLLSSRLAAQPIRKLGPASHQSKVGTPTFGGFPLIFAAAISTLAWADVSGSIPWYLASLFAFASIGLLDDLLKIRRQSSDGLKMFQKLGLQFLAAMLLLVGIQQAGISGTGAFVPFVGNTGPWSPVLWYVGSCLLLVFITNAVNLSDGLDGLVTIPVLLVAGGLGILGLLSDPLIVGDAFSGLPHLPGGRGAFLFAGALAGALLAFLWFNAPPARLFMGDTGALALGGVLGMIGIILNQHIFLLLMGGVFVLEGVSVVLQIFWFRWSSGGRLFRMAPFHHHLELGGWPETRITVRFWIITAVLVALSLTAALLTITLT